MRSNISPELNIMILEGWEDYALLDSGNGKKLERFGHYKLIRPEAEAIWKPALPDTTWYEADAIFHSAPEENGGHWEIRTKMPERWQIEFQDLKCWLQLSNSRHLGIFPEQSSQWSWIQKNVKGNKEPIKILNLFGYTGLASLAAAQAGARVTHVDASRKALSWAKENQLLSNLSEKPIRWILDDAFKFVQRESRRNSSYDAIIMDPPKFGRGPKGEVWEFYKLLPDLLTSCKAILSNRPSFIMVTAYAVKASSLTLYSALKDLMSDLKGEVFAGELTIKESSASRLLSTSVFSIWASKDRG